MTIDKKIIKELIDESIQVKKMVYDEIPNIEGVCREIVNCYKKGNKLLIFGNGGSAADAQHIAGELVGRFNLERKALSAIALTTDTSVITALSNDYSYSKIFERQVEALAKYNDLLFGISTSGNSENVINALKKGRDIGTLNISLTGNNGGKIKNFSDYNINVDSKNTPRIQEAHVLIYHIIYDIVERELFGGKK